MVSLATTLVRPSTLTLASSLIKLSISTHHLRTIITTYWGVILLMLLTLYDFYFVPNDMDGYIDGDSTYVLTLYTNDITPTSIPVCYENNFKFNYDSFS